MHDMELVSGRRGRRPHSKVLRKIGRCQLWKWLENLSGLVECEGA